MKATKAYIASLGTTGVLLAASVLMLAVVSAVVAFDRWPGAGVASPIQTVALNERPATIRVTGHSSAPSATSTVRAATRGAVVAAPRATGRAPVVAGKQFSGGRVTSPGGATPAQPALPAPVQKTLEPVQQTTDPIFDAVSNPGSTAGAVANGTQQVTDALGKATTKLNPDLGNVVTATGQAVAQTVRDLPLPQHVLPNH